MRFLILAAVLLTACLESDDPKKVELVDNTTKNDPNAGKLVVSDEDFAALQAEVKALKNELASLKSGKADKASVTALDSELSAIAASVNGLAVSSVQQLWLYDGNGTKKHRVVSIQDRNGYQVAIVEALAGVHAKYRISVPSYSSSHQAPLPLETPGSDYSTTSVPAIRYSSAGCAGEAVVSDNETGGDHGQAGAIGNFLAWIDQNSPRQTSFAFNSSYGSMGTCSNISSTLSSVRIVTTAPLSNYTYPNPLTVGP